MCACNFTRFTPSDARESATERHGVTGKSHGREEEEAGAHSPILSWARRNSPGCPLKLPSPSRPQPHVSASQCISAMQGQGRGATIFPPPEVCKADRMEGARKVRVGAPPSAVGSP